jgi:hypothetical protein
LPQKDAVGWEEDKHKIAIFFEMGADKSAAILTSEQN